MNKIFLIIAVTLFSLNTSAQKENRVGIEVTGENTGGGFAAGLGATFERKLSRHSGFETGVFYRTIRRDFYVVLQNNFYSYTMAERYLSIPFLYKFSSSIVNVSVGPTVDFFIGWKEKNRRDETHVDSYSATTSAFLGALLKISKEINLSDNLILEPELRLNPVINNNNIYGGGIAVKYKLSNK